MRNFIVFIVAVFFPLFAFASILGAQQGGTASSSLTGIIVGNGINPVNSLTIGTNLTLTGTTLNASGGGTNYFTNSSLNTYLNTGTNLQAPTINATSTTGTSTIQNSLYVAGSETIGTTTASKIFTVEGNQPGGVASIRRDFPSPPASSIIGTYDIALNEITSSFANFTGPAQTFGGFLNGGPTESLWASISAYRDGADNNGGIEINPYASGVLTNGIAIDHLDEVAVATTSSQNSQLDVQNTNGDTNILNLASTAGAPEFSVSNSGFVNLTSTSNSNLTPGSLIYDNNNFLTFSPDGTDRRAVVLLSPYQNYGTVQRYGVSFTNFLSNAGFEYWYAGNSSAPSGWTVQGATAARTTNATQGTYAAELTFANPDDQIRQDFYATSSVPYTFSVWVRRVSGSGSASLVAQEEGGSFTEYKNVGCQTSSTYQLCALTFTVPAGAPNTMRFKFASQTTGTTVWDIDEAMLQEGSSTATAMTYAPIDDSSSGQNVYGVKNFYSGIFVDSNDSTASGYLAVGATTTPGSIFSVANILNLAAATSTFYATGGINIENGCFAINGTCVGGGGGGSGTVNSGTTGQDAFYASNGTAVSATSTIYLSPASFVGLSTSTPLFPFVSQVGSGPDVLEQDTLGDVGILRLGSGNYNILSEGGVEIMPGTTGNSGTGSLIISGPNANTQYGININSNSNRLLNISNEGSGNLTTVFGPTSGAFPGTGMSFIGLNATSSPWALLSIEGTPGNTTVPNFAVATSSTGSIGTTTAFMIDALGNTSVNGGASFTVTNGATNALQVTNTGMVNITANATSQTETTITGNGSNTILALSANGTTASFQLTNTGSGGKTWVFNPTSNGSSVGGGNLCIFTGTCSNTGTFTGLFLGGTGSIYVGTTSATNMKAEFAIAATSSESVNFNLFNIATSSGASLFSVNGGGTVAQSGDNPACGTGCSTVAGNNQGGQIVTTTLATSVTITFADGGFPSGGTMSCTNSDNSTSINFDVSAISNTSVTFTAATGLTGTLYYQCGSY